MNLTEKLKIALIKQHQTLTSIAEKTGQTRNNLANKVARNDFKLSEFEKLVEAMGCELELNIVLPDGTKI